ncbi:hypothetical protein SAMN05421505_1742 [Sinosporangium album]|uniref:Uncharacterized protein n=1 Tax=Sinosporangium album TaxID=504805 RepID=A0A1G8LPD4_9ACTN|nr:hypothetical protein SAMN05421505_1742 [Sinosporangium album]
MPVEAPPPTIGHRVIDPGAEYGLPNLLAVSPANGERLGQRLGKFVELAHKLS